MMKFNFFILRFLIGFLALFPQAQIQHVIAAQPLPPALKDVGITEHLGDQISLNEFNFRDEAGQAVKLSQFFERKKPVLLVFVYFECPSLCGLLLNGLLSSLKEFKWTPGQEFEIVTVSINPKEGPELALKKKETYLSAYGRPGASSGWHFLTGEESQIKSLAAKIGFGYRYVEEEKQFAHSAALFILTPGGKISRYLYGIQFSEKDLRLSLVEASEGRVGSIVDRFLLFCYRYDPLSRSYSLVLTRVLQAAAAGTVVLLGLILSFLWRSERRRMQAASNETK